MQGSIRPVLVVTIVTTQEIRKRTRRKVSRPLLLYAAHFISDGKLIRAARYRMQ